MITREGYFPGGSMKIAAHKNFSFYFDYRCSVGLEICAHHSLTIFVARTIYVFASRIAFFGQRTLQRNVAERVTRI